MDLFDMFDERASVATQTDAGDTAVKDIAVQVGNGDEVQEVGAQTHDADIYGSARCCSGK